MSAYTVRLLSEKFKVQIGILEHFRILSSSPGLKFSPERWKIQIFYSFNSLHLNWQLNETKKNSKRCYRLKYPNNEMAFSRKFLPFHLPLEPLPVTEIQFVQSSDSLANQA